MKKIIIIAVFLPVLIISGSCFPAEEWENVSSSLRESQVNCLAISYGRPTCLYAGTSKAVYKSLDWGRQWNQMLRIKGGFKNVNFIEIDSSKNNIFAATQNGLYKSTGNGNRWGLVFKGLGELQKQANYLATDQNTIYLATENGLFINKNSERLWRRSPSLSGFPVYIVKINKDRPDVVFAGTSKGLYKSMDKGETWDRVYVTSQVENKLDEENLTEPAELEKNPNKIQAIEIDPKNGILYIGTQNGIFAIDENGQKTTDINDEGLLNKNIRHLLIFPGNAGYMLAATEKGIFVYSKNANVWHELYSGAITQINFLAFDGKYLWVAADNGIFKRPLQAESLAGLFIRDNLKSNQDLSSYFKNEPTIAEIQEAAIKYAEVDSKKIEAWRKGAQMKALLPSLNLGVDSSVSNSYEIYTSTSKYYTVMGPEDKSTKWGVSVNWDLSDLIWNNDQTSIDTRSRLMVQLRDDILDEVTKYYFERRRLQINMVADPPQDERAKLEYDLRLQELTARIDGLTNGYLSKKLAKSE